MENMKRLLFIAFLVVAALIGYFTIISSREDPTDGTTFYYYPRVNMYYDVERERYIYPDSIEGGWQKTRKLPGDGKDKLGKYFILNNPKPPVWSQNSHHRLLYGTALYAKENDIRRKFIEDSLRSVPKPRPVPRKAPVAKDSIDKRNGIERFFDRLFGKEE
jgi:hypothetical protein